MVKIYNVGPDEICESDCKGFEWVVCWYELGDWCGDGEAVSFDGKEYRQHCLGHCSCYGPEEGMGSGDIITLATLFGDTVEPGVEIKQAIIEKVREILSFSA